MRRGLICLFASMALAGCAAPAPPPKKPSPVKRDNGEQRLRDSLAHTNPQPRRK